MKHKKQKTNCSIGNQQQGFTLVEFMVASVLGLVVIAGAGALYSYTKRLNDIGMARVATLQDLRSAATMIGQDSRSAGVFGCASLGRRHDPDATNAEIRIHGTQPTNLAAQLLTLDSATQSAGVRWLEKDSNEAKSIWDDSVFTPQSGVLVFYYGEGSLSFNSAQSTVSKVHFNRNENHPNKIVSNMLIDGTGGHLVAAGCNDLVLVTTDGNYSKPTFEVDVPVTAVGTASGSLTAPGAVTASAGIQAHADMVLQRYKVVAYVVGDIAGEPTSLYRFEFGNNGDDWSAPQQLAKNVKDMKAEYLFVTECESGMLASTGGSAGTLKADLNSQTFEIKDAKGKGSNNNVSEDSNGDFHGPSSIRLTLTYNFPKIRGGSVATGKVKADGVTPEDEEFNITAVVRGGNVCASRKIVPF